MTEKEAGTLPAHDDPTPGNDRRAEAARIARAIVETLAPRSVFSAGPYAGLLVEELRRRSVQADGITRSGESPPPSVRQHLLETSLGDPLPKTYDLVLCLDALNGLSPQQVEKALANLCRSTERVLISGPGEMAPGDLAALFARSGFFRDLAFEAPAISASAALFLMEPGLAADETARRYEERFNAIQRENAALRSANRDQAEALERARLEFDTVTGTLTARLAQWESIWADVEKSAAWRFIHQVRRLRLWLAPPGSRRAALLRIARESAGVLLRRGPLAFLRHWRTGLRSADFRFAPGRKTIEQRNAEAYPDFVRRSALDAAGQARQREIAAAWRNRPRISFITPVYRPTVDVLQALIDSVRAQTYERWELCIADASPDSPEVRALLQRCAAQDERIRVEYLEANLGVCGNSNRALQMASGEYIAILDHDDTVEPDMLFEVVRRLQENSFADVVYFDEDKLSEDGSQRRDPFFKPDFSPETLLSANYLMHAVYRRALVEEAGGFDPAFEGCQDWDLAFKITERSSQVEHIPRVLYHWRQVSGSTAGEFGAKAYVFERQLKCVQDHLRRSGLPDARAEFARPGVMRLHWPASGAKVSIIIPTRDRVDFLRRTVESLLSRTRYPDFELIIVDNESRKAATLKYLDRLRARPDVRIVDYRDKFNYSRANNLGAQHASGDILLFLNNDVEILDGGWLEEMVRWADRPEVGVVGARLLYPDGSIQHAGVVVGMEGHASHVFWGYRDRQTGPFGPADWYRNFTAVTGACMMVRREVFEESGGFSEKYILAFSDIELCMRLAGRGYRVVYTPHACLRHFEGKSRGDHIPSNDIRVGVEDFMPLVERGDPFYNPNLSYVERKPLLRPEGEEDRVSRLLRVAAGARVNDLVADS